MCHVRVCSLYLGPAYWAAIFSFFFHGFDGGTVTVLIQTSQGPSEGKQGFKFPLELRRNFNHFPSFLGKDSTYREVQ